MAHGADILILCVYVQMNTGALEGQRCRVPLELEAVVTQYMQGQEVLITC